MSRWTVQWVTTILAALAVIGCDRRPTPPPPQAATPPPPTTIPEEVRPTTQELLSGPTHKLMLPNMPLSVTVPMSWKIESTGPLTLLTGPAPSDRAMIQLAQRRPIPADRVATVIDVLRRDQDKLEGNMKPSTLRDLGKMKILERLGHARPTAIQMLNSRGEPVIDEKGNSVTVTTTPLSWTLSIFIPNGDVIEQYDLNLIGAGLEQYETDRDLLEKIFYSVAYEATAPMPTTAPAMTPPAR